MSTFAWVALVLSACTVALASQSPGASGNQSDAFRVRRTAADLDALLDPDHPDWARAHAAVWGPAPYPTAFRVLHGDAGMVVSFAATDNAPWFTMTERDDHIWNEEVVEIFIDPDGDGLNYAEIEISPANVVCDLQIFATEPELSSDIGWDFDGLRTRVTPWVGSTGDQIGWIATAVLPWSGFASLNDTDVDLPPGEGDRWRFNVFRIKRPGGPQHPERDAVYAPWSPTPSLSFHAPSAFREFVFVDD